MSTLNRTNGVTGTAVAGAVTVNGRFGKITTEALVTAAGANYPLTVTDPGISATDMAFASVDQGTNTTGDPGVLRVTPGAGSLVILVRNHHASVALNGTLKVSFASFPV